MSYQIDVHYKDGTTGHTEYAEYRRAKEHVNFRLESAEVAAVRITNGMTGKVRFERATCAIGLRWLGPKGA